MYSETQQPCGNNAEYVDLAMVVAGQVRLRSQNVAKRHRLIAKETAEFINRADVVLAVHGVYLFFNCTAMGKRGSKSPRCCLLPFFSFFSSMSVTKPKLPLGRMSNH